MKCFLVATVVFVSLVSAPGLRAEPKVQLLIQGNLRSEDDVVSLANRDIVRSGEEIRFELVSNERAYVYLLTRGSSGRLSVLQPFSGQTADALQEAGVARSLPSAGEFLPLDETLGKEFLYAFASAEPLRNLPKLVSKLESLEYAGVEEELREEFPGLVVVELQHLPGPMALRSSQRNPDRAATPVPQPSRVERGVFKGSVAPEEPGVLSNEGSVIRSLIENRPNSSPTQGIPSRDPNGTKTDAVPMPSSRLPPNRGREQAAVAQGGSNVLSQGDDNRGWWNRVGSLFSSKGSTNESPGSATALTRPGEGSAPAVAVNSGQPPPDRSTGFQPPSVADGSSGSSVLAAPSSWHFDLEETGASVVLVVTGTGISGTGVIVSEGRVLTSGHLVDNPAQLSVLTRGDGGVADPSTRHAARVVRHNVFTDLALLEVDPPLSVSGSLGIAASELDPAPGEQVLVFSHDTHQTWQHERAVVIEVDREHSWFSASNVIHRGPTIQAKMASPPATDGAPVLNIEQQLVGLKVRSGPGEGVITAVSAVAIRAFLEGGIRGG